MISPRTLLVSLGSNSYKPRYLLSVCISGLMSFLSSHWGLLSTTFGWRKSLPLSRLGNDPIRIDPGSILDWITKDWIGSIGSIQDRPLVS